MSRKIYVVWKVLNGGIDSDTFTIDGPINHKSVTECVKHNISYWREQDFDVVISWQVEEYDN